ncbi:MAG: hypothetical protein WAV11_02285 [Minisyncoccia bacterium]
MKTKNKIGLGIIIFLFSFIITIPAGAATLELTLNKEITSAKDDIVVSVALNSEGQSVNTAQANISFPSNLLEVTKIDRTNSIFTFWLQDPIYDNSNGTISFVGGSTNDFNGASLNLLQISFRVKGSGTGKLGITDGAITASDGTGSNVYTTAKGLDINIPTTAEFQAVKIERANLEATLAKTLPKLIGLEVPFYPDPQKWNNRSASFQARWNIGADIVKAAVLLDKKLSSEPTASTEAMSGSKIFPALLDGIWYLHISLKNNIGWSPTLHYRLAIDTTPPTPVIITSKDNLKTSNPRPTISYSSTDSISGISNYIIAADGVIATTTNKTSYTFNPLLPGTRRISVSAVDNANNSTTKTISLEIIPIDSPIIISMSQHIFVGEGDIVGKGTATSGVEVIVHVQNADKQIISEQSMPVDSHGNWSVAISNNLKPGVYNILVTARNKDMASSFPTISKNIVVKERPFLVLGSFEITLAWFFTCLIIILLLTFGAGVFTYYRWLEQLGHRVTIAERDVINTLNNLDSDVSKLQKNYSNGISDRAEINETKSILKNIKMNIEKAHRYVVENIREINK